ncbi:MAG: hypothetical protein LBF38_12710 [Deltaproteobacteria bacterium]|jgi:ferredoxin|nr:hypothetical protein [Deltaproteobacteria bacterium]
MGSSGHKVLKAWPVPTEVSLAFEGRPAPGLKPGRAVSGGELLAVSHDPLTGDLRAPFSARVIELTPNRIDLRFGPGLSGQVPEPLELEKLEGEGLAQALKSLGVDQIEKPPEGEPIIISALNPEPGLELTRALWLDQKPTLERGLKLLNRLWPKSEIIEVLPPKFTALGPKPPTHYKEPFPLTLPSFLRFKILGLKYPRAMGVVSPQTLWAMGTIARSGLPLTLIPTTVHGYHYLAPPGLKLLNALNAVNLKPLTGDLVLLGGLVTGRPAARLERGLKASDLALSLIRSKSLPPPPRPCRLCALCRLACPLNLPIDSIAQVHPGQWPNLQKAAQKALRGCGGCGACALACPSRRPLLLLAKVAGAGDPYGRDRIEPRAPGA